MNLCDKGDNIQERVENWRAEEGDDRALEGSVKRPL